VIGHLGINVPELATARTYYDELMPVLGFELFLSDEDQFAFRPRSGKPGTYLFVYQATRPSQYSRDHTGLQHLAFMVPSRSAVHDALGRAVELGSQVVHLPQEFPDYPPPYFAAFWLDPFGIMLEAVCHHDRP
jgi:catechol 2,3-dioxygenase-like lactoylglutathione lyase family enzyme